MNLKMIGGAIAGFAVLAVGAFVLWFFVLREDGPEAVSTDSALESLDKATATAAAGTTPASGATPPHRRRLYHQHRHQRHMERRHEC
ncbi:MAG: hypothetical protein IPI85_11850 [Dehalococcoidia bacterium]|nr:hypothetical protein [Dehalococcoidia bacterium]